MGIKETDSDTACDASAGAVGSAAGSDGTAKPAGNNTADYFISIVEQAEEQRANSYHSGMATPDSVQWHGDQQRMLPQTDAAVLASGRMQPPSSMWQLSTGLGSAPMSAAMAIDHPALGFSMLQNRLQMPLKQEPCPQEEPSTNPQSSGQPWASPFTSLGMYGGDLAALNPMPVVSTSGLLPGMNAYGGPGQADYAAFQQRQQQGGQGIPDASGSFHQSSSQFPLPNSFGMTSASSFNVLPSSASADTFSLTPKSFGSEPLPRPASMPALMGGPLQFEPGTGMPQPSGRRKGRGGRTAAMDPRLDPNIDPKKAKRILANRLSAARSKNKQRGHLDILEGAHNTLVQQKEELMRELAWLRAEVKMMEEERPKLEGQLKALEEHALLQEALQLKLIEQCGHQNPFHQADNMGNQMQMPDHQQI